VALSFPSQTSHPPLQNGSMTDNTVWINIILFINNLSK